MRIDEAGRQHNVVNTEGSWLIVRDCCHAKGEMNTSKAPTGQSINVFTRVSEMAFCRRSHLESGGHLQPKGQSCWRERASIGQEKDDEPVAPLPWAPRP